MDFLIMKEIEDFEGYFADEEGNIWGNRKCMTNLNRELRQLKPALSEKGYPYVVLCINGKRYTKRVHRLVALAFIPNPENKATVNHINGIKTDNRPCNLEWATIQENTQHAFDTGLKVALKGEKQGNSKLTEAQVLLIRADTRTQKLIGMDYGVDQSIISDIKMRKTWNHI